MWLFQMIRSAATTVAFYSDMHVCIIASDIIIKGIMIFEINNIQMIL